MDFMGRYNWAIKNADLDKANGLRLIDKKKY